MDYSNIPLGLKITTQIPLDAKTIVNSEAVLSNLGFNNNLAFTYYDGMVVTCQLEKTDWQWREVVGSEVGLLATNFTYPNNIVVNGITYSLKNYNFFKKLQNVSEKQDNILANYKVLPSNFNFTSIPTGYENATWIIRYNFNLNDASITLPANVTLSFEGGSITNGSIVLNNTTIDYKNIKSILNDVVLTGTLTNNSLDVRLFGILPDNNSIDATVIYNTNLVGLDVTLFFPKGNYYFSELHVTKNFFRIEGEESNDLEVRTVFHPFNASQYYTIKIGGTKFTLNNIAAPWAKNTSIMHIWFTTPSGFTGLNLPSDAPLTNINYRCSALILDKAQGGRYAINGHSLHNMPLLSIGNSYELYFDYIKMHGNHGKSDLPIIQVTNNYQQGGYISASVIHQLWTDIMVGPVFAMSGLAGMNEFMINNVYIEGTLEWEGETVTQDTRFTRLTENLPAFYSTVQNLVPMFSIGGVCNMTIGAMFINATDEKWQNSLDQFPTEWNTRSFFKLDTIASDIKIGSVSDGTYGQNMLLKGIASIANRNTFQIVSSSPEIAYYNQVSDNFDFIASTNNSNVIKLKPNQEYFNNDLSFLIEAKFLENIGLNNHFITPDESKYNKTISTRWDNYIINESGFYIEDDFIKIVGKIPTTNNIIDIEYYNVSNALISTQNYSVAVTANALFENTIVLTKPAGYSYLKLKSKNTGFNLKTYSLTTTSSLKNYIKSNESLSLAKRKGDVLYGILDQYTGEEITLSKVTGTPTVDGIMFFQLGSEYFKRNITKVNPYIFGAKADGVNNDTSALQSAINFSSANSAVLELKGNFLANTITISDDIELETVCKIQSIIDNDILIIDGAKVNHTGSLTLRGFTRNTLNRGIVLKNGVLNSTFDKVYISNTGLGVDYEASGNNNIVAWNLLDVRSTSSSATTVFVKGDFVSNTTLYNIGQITTNEPILTNMGTIIVEGEVYPIVAKPGFANTYYVGNFYSLPSGGILYYYSGGGVMHRKHTDNGAIEYKTLRLWSIAGSSITVQSLYGVTVNGGEIEGCGTNVVVGGIYMNGLNPETIYSIRSLFEGLHTEANTANKPFVYSLKNSMITFNGCIMGDGVEIGSPESGVKFQSGYGTDITSNYYYGKPNEDFPAIEPNNPEFKIYKDLTTGTSVYLNLRDLKPMMKYNGDLRVNYVTVGEYNMLNIPAGETRTLVVTPYGTNTLNGGTAAQNITVTGVLGKTDYRIMFLLVDNDFTYYIDRGNKFSSSSLNITTTTDEISIELIGTTDVPSLIVNSDYAGTEELGTASKPFKNLQNALDTYVGNGASNKAPDLLGTIIKIQKDINVFTGSLSYKGLNIEISNGASLITNPSASNYVLDLDSDAVLPTNINYSMIPFTNTEAVTIQINILGGGSLQAQKRFIKNRGNNNISGEGKFIKITGDGSIINLAEASVISPSVKNLFSLNEDNQVGFVNGNSTANVSVFCNINSYNSQIAYVGLNAKYYSTQNLTQFGQLATPFNSNTIPIEINGGQFIGDGATIENDYNNAPTYSLITLISLKSEGLYINKGATIGKVCENIFLNKDTGSTTTCQVILDNCNSASLQTNAVFKSLMSSNLWNVRLTNCNFAFWGVNEAKVKLIPGSINTLASKVVETLPIYDSRAAAITGGLFTGCKFINTAGVVSPTTGWIVDIVI